MPSTTGTSLLLTLAVLGSVAALPVSPATTREPGLCCGWANDLSMSAVADRIQFSVAIREQNRTPQLKVMVLKS